MLTDSHAHQESPRNDLLRIRNVGDPSAPAPDGFFSAGIHPKDAEAFDPQSFMPLLLHERCKAVGECGLDRLAAVPLPRQTEAFLKQVELAEELKKPMILHCVRCRQEILRMKRRREPAQIWIMHGFRGNERAAFELLDAGMVLSFGAGLLRDAGAVETFFSRIPEDRVLIESDESPDSLERVAALAAQMRGMDPPSFLNLVETNFRRIFHVEA